MDGFWEKVSSYNIFNNLFPGALFIYFLEKMLHLSLSGSDLVKSVILYYFVGLVISRVGSILLEPLLKLIGIIKFRPYEAYISACKNDPKIELLQEVANMYRTLMTMSLLLISSIILMRILTGEKFSIPLILSFLFLALFLISYIKQIKFIVKRIDN